MFCQDVLRSWRLAEAPRVPVRQMSLYAWPAGPAGAPVRLSCGSPGATWTPKVPQTAVLASSKCNLNAKSAQNCQVGLVRLKLQRQHEPVQGQLDYKWHLNSKLHWNAWAS